MAIDCYKKKNQNKSPKLHDHIVCLYHFQVCIVEFVVNYDQHMEGDVESFVEILYIFFKYRQLCCVCRCVLYESTYELCTLTYHQCKEDIWSNFFTFFCGCDFCPFFSYGHESNVEFDG